MEPPVEFLTTTLPFTDVKVSTIYPLQRRAHVETIDATLLDLQQQDVCFPLLFAYRLAIKSEAVFLQQVKRVKESLQQVLVSFFPYAGRWIPDPEDISKRKLLCNDEGVPFIEAYLDRDLDSVVNVSTSFQPVPELQGFRFLGLDGTQVKQRMPPGGLPCIFVQVTRFKCGGVAFAVTFNHTLTDGTGFVKFMRAWVDINQSTQANTRFEVDHSRAQILEALSMNTVFSDPQITNTMSSDVVEGTEPPLERRAWAMKNFEVTVSTIESIKQQAKDMQGGGIHVSTVDCIAAHLWKCLAELPSSMFGGKDASVVTTVEGRARFYATPQPNLSANVVAFLPSPNIPTDELREMPVASIASKLRDLLVTTKREEWLTSGKINTVFRGNKFAAMQIISWLRFPVYMLDFGWGQPALSTLNGLMHFSDRLGKVYITPPLPNSSSSVATVQIFCRHDVLQALEQDPNFQAFFMGHTKTSSKALEATSCLD